MAGTELAVGILGAGYFGACRARAVADSPGRKLAAICDCDLEQARRLAAAYGGVSYADWRQLLAEAAIDVVVIATPHHLHMRSDGPLRARLACHAVQEEPNRRHVERHHRADNERHVKGDDRHQDRQQEADAGSDVEKAGVGGE